MEKGKVISIVAAGILGLVAIFLVINLIKNNKSFTSLVVSYKDNKQVYDDLKVDSSVIVINDVSFWIVSRTNDAVVLSSSEYLKDDNKESNEFKVTIDKEKQVCFEASDCVYFTLE